MDNELKTTTVEDQYLAKIEELKAEVVKYKEESDRHYKWYKESETKFNYFKDAVKSIVVLVD